MSPVYASSGAGRSGKIDLGRENLHREKDKANGDRDWVLCGPLGDPQLTPYLQ